MSDVDFATFLGDVKTDVPADNKTAEDKPIQPKTDDELKLVDDDQDDDDEEETPEKESEEETEDKDEDEDEKKLVLEDEDEVTLDIPNREKIKKEFPDLFKKFPSIEKAIYREQQYAEVFPHPKDAEQAKESLSVLANIESELGNGNIENLLNSVKKFDEKSFNQITENFLPTLQKLNPQAHFNTVNYVLKQALFQANEYGKSADKESDNYQIALAARILNRWIYQTGEVKAPEALGSAIKQEFNPKEEELNKRETEFHRGALATAVTEVDERVMSTLTKSIENVIDTKNLMSPYVKGNATKDVVNQFRDDLRKDKRFMANLDRLWVKCREANYSEASKSKIREAIKLQAKQVLPDIIRRVKAEALKDYKKVARTDRKDERPLERRRPSADTPKRSNDQKEQARKMTATEFLLQD